MIADTYVGVYPTSSWRSDLHRGQGGDSSDHDLSVIGDSFSKVKVERNNNWGRNLSGFSSTSCGTSVASSECSDEPLVDIETDLDDGFFVSSSDTGYLTTSLLNVFDEENLSLGSFDWSSVSFDDDDDDDERLIDRYDDSHHTCKKLSKTNLKDIRSAHHPPSHSLDQAGVKRAKCRRGITIESVSRQLQKTKHNLDDVELQECESWAELSCEEQLSIIEELTEVVSNRLGLREQLEVIRIINPGAAVAPTDTEFVIDLECLDSEKLCRVREYVRQQMAQKRSQPQCTNSQASHAASAQKKATKKQRRSQQRGVQLQSKKVVRQSQKEVRSGLFLREEVLSLMHCDPGSADEVDILT